MNTGRPTKAQTGHRDHLEIAQAELIGLVRDLDEVIIRTKQAIRRTPIVADVLEPSIGRLAELRASLNLIHAEINQAWQEGQERNWSYEDKNSAG